MEMSADNEHLTPKKDVRAFSSPMKLMKMVPHVYYSPTNLRKECNKLNNGCQSSAGGPFTFLGNHSTPPSRCFTIRNPFDAALAARLHQPISSPSVFLKSVGPPRPDKFQWSIEDISSLNPAPIEEFPSSQFEQPEDPEIESTAHANIEKYFKEVKHIVPSPWDQKLKPLHMLHKNSFTPLRSISEKPKRDGITQTTLTLPPTLPPHVEEVLSSYFTYTVDQQQADLDDSNTSLCRRLFHHSDVSTENESEMDYNALSPIQSPLPNSDELGKDCNNTSVFGLPRAKSLSLSPIACTSLSNVCASKKSPFIQSTPTPSPQSLKNINPATLEESPLSPIFKNPQQSPQVDAKLSVTKSSPPILEMTNEDMKMVVSIAHNNSSRRSNKRLNFSANMSVDTSMAMVPDAENLPDNSMNLMTSLGATILANEEDCTYSSVNWDIENRSISNTKKIKHVDLDDINLDSVITAQALPKSSQVNTNHCSNITEMSSTNTPVRSRPNKYFILRKYSENFDANKENIPYRPRKVALRRSLSDVPFGSSPNQFRAQYEVDIYRRQKLYSSTSTNNDDSIIRERSILNRDRTASSPTVLEDDIFTTSHTHDTGYNSHTGSGDFGHSSYLSPSSISMSKHPNESGNVNGQYDVNTWRLNNLIASTPSKKNVSDL